MYITLNEIVHPLVKKCYRCRTQTCGPQANVLIIGVSGSTGPLTSTHLQKQYFLSHLGIKEKYWVYKWIYVPRLWTPQQVNDQSVVSEIQGSRDRVLRRETFFHTQISYRSVQIIQIFSKTISLCNRTYSCYNFILSIIPVI